MSEEIIKVIDNLAQKFGIAVDWTSSNIIPYLEDLMSRFIAYRNTLAIIQIILALAVLVIAIICIKKLIKWSGTKEFKEDYDNEDIFMWSMSGTIVVWIVCVVVLIGNGMGLAKNIFIPEMTVIEYIQDKI